MENFEFQVKEKFAPCKDRIKSIIFSRAIEGYCVARIATNAGILYWVNEMTLPFVDEIVKVIRGDL